MSKDKNMELEDIDFLVKLGDKLEKEEQERLSGILDRLGSLSNMERDELERAKLKPIVTKKRTSEEMMEEPPHVQELQLANASYQAEINKYNRSFNSLGFPNASVNSLRPRAGSDTNNSNFKQGPSV